MEKDTKIIEFRCFCCKKLLAKTYTNSYIEIKCRGCKNLNIFNVGDIYLKYKL